MDRRHFIKTSAAAAAGLAFSCSRPSSGDTDDTFPADLTEQNSRVNSVRLETDIDAMARVLAKKDTAAEAWQTIFQKPSDKTWDQVRAAIKYNEVGVNLPRVALIGKIAAELISLGVKPENIAVYGGRNPNDPVYTSLVGAACPAGVRISQYGSELGGTVQAAIPAVTKGDHTITDTECIKDIAEHTNDILVNVAVNKGHWDQFGGFTLCMKNHFGTFDPQPFRIYSSVFDVAHGTFDYLTAINKAECLIGGAVPQQQLCIIDSLWVTRVDNVGAPGDDTPYHTLTMGTFAPGVDYLTAGKVRAEMLGLTLPAVSEEILPAFGYNQAAAAAVVPAECDPDNPVYSDITGYPASSTVPQINPAIDNMRVVCCTDEKMVTA